MPLPASAVASLELFSGVASYRTGLQPALCALVGRCKEEAEALLAACGRLALLARSDLERACEDGMQ